MKGTAGDTLQFLFGMVETRNGVDSSSGLATGCQLATCTAGFAVLGSGRRRPPLSKLAGLHLYNESTK
jgi:hypothetical protein